MQIDRIGRDKSYEMLGPYGLKVWDKVSVSGTISEGEDIQQAYQQLDKILEAAHKPVVEELGAYRGTKTRILEQPADTSQDDEFNLIKQSVIDAPTKDAAMELINNSGNWKIPLEFQTREIVKSKP